MQWFIVVGSRWEKGVLDAHTGTIRNFRHLGLIILLAIVAMMVDSSAKVKLPGTGGALLSRQHFL